MKQERDVINLFFLEKKKVLLWTKWGQTFLNKRLQKQVGKTAQKSGTFPNPPINR